MMGMAGQHGYTKGPPPSPDSPGSLSVSDYVLPEPGSPTWSRLGSMPVAGSLSPPPGQLWPSEDRFPSPPGFSVNPYTLSSTSHQPEPQSPEVDLGMNPLLELERFSAEFWDEFMKGKIHKRHTSGSDAVNLAQRTQGHEYSNLNDLPQFNSQGLLTDF